MRCCAQDRVDLRLGHLALKLDGPEGRSTKAALGIPRFLLRSGIFRISRLLLKNSILKLVGVFAFSIPVILFGALFYQIASGKTFWDGMVHIYGALYKIPGMLPSAVRCLDLLTIQLPGECRSHASSNDMISL